jgi:hypothetical protein
MESSMMNRRSLLAFALVSVLGSTGCTMVLGDFTMGRVDAGASQVDAGGASREAGGAGEDASTVAEAGVDAGVDAGMDAAPYGDASDAGCPRCTLGSSTVGRCCLQ